MLTKKQKLFLDYITKFIEKNGYAPSFEEIKKHFKLSAKSTVHQHVTTLTEKGFLNKEHYRARAISIVQDAPLSPTPLYTPTYSYEYQEQPIQRDKIDSFLNKIICSDAVEVMEKMPDCSIDLTVTSPPYDELRSYNGYHFNFEGMAKNLFRVTKNGGILVWVVGDQTTKGSETGTSFKQALYFKQIGFNLFDTMIYLKTPRGAVGNNKTYWQAFEYMFIFSKGNPKTVNLIKDRKNKESRNGDNGTKRLQNGKLLNLKRGGYGEFGRRTNVWEYLIGRGHSASDNIAYKHPAIFPEKLVQDHIISWSNHGEVVFDPMCGSGTTCKIAKLNKRNFIGIDISSEYCKIAEERLRQKSLL